MSTDQSKAVSRRYFEELWTKGIQGVIDQIIAPGVTGHVAGKTFRGAEVLRERMSSLRSAYSDVRITVEDQIAEGEKVLVRWKFHGKHTGEYMGAKPTGKAISTTGMNLFRIVAGKIEEIWVESDDLGELQQLGVVTLPK